MLRTWTVTCLLLLAASVVALAEPITVYRGIVRLDGTKEFEIDVYYAKENAPYLAVDELCRGLRWTVEDDRHSGRITLQGKPFTDFARHQGRTFVSAGAIAGAFDYRMEMHRGGRWVDYWTRPAALAPGQVRLTMGRQERLQLTHSNEISYNVTVRVRNDTDRDLPLQASSFQLIDRSGARYPCRGEFTVGVPAHREVAVDRLYFIVPYQHDIRELVLVDPQGAIVEKARW